MIRRYYAIGAALCILSMTGPALAQSTSGSPSASPTGNTLQEVVVTAQRREQNMQKVPISITAVTAQQLKRSGVTGTLDLPTLVPSLTLANDAGYAVTYLRGLGTDLTGVGTEPSVATYIDGVYVPEQIGTIMSFNNIEQVEVLKGPQGTLFGRNATGGVILITTRDPSHQPSADASVSYSRFDTTDANLYATGGVTRTVAADIAVYYHDQGDGYGENPDLNTSIWKSRELSLRSKVLWTPSDDTRVTLGLDFSNVWSSLGVDWRMLPGSVALDGVTHYTGFYTQNGGPDFIKEQQKGAMLKLEQNLHFMRLISISAYRSVPFTERLDQTDTQVPIVNAYWTQPTRNISEELQLQSASESPVQWVLGTFFFNSNASWRFNLTGAAAAPFSGEFMDFFPNTKSYAEFGQATFPVMTDTHLTLGLRYTSDRQSESGAGYGYGDIVPLYSGAQKKTFSKLTWRFALDHQLTPNVMTYVSYNRGFKSGVFGQSTPSQPPVQPEVVDAYELGLKSMFLQNRVRLNPSVFYYDYKNIQTEVFSNGVVLFQNAAAARIYGLDLDTAAAVTSRLTVHGGLSYLHGRYTSFPAAAAYLPNPGGVGDYATTVDATGHETVHSPPVSLDVSGSYLVPSPLGDVTLDATYSYTDRYYWDANNRIREPVVHMLNLAATWSAPSANWDVRLWVRNALNEKYYVWEVAGAPGDEGIPAEPVTYGVTIGYHL